MPRVRRPGRSRLSHRERWATRGSGPCGVSSRAVVERRSPRSIGAADAGQRDDNNAPTPPPGGVGSGTRRSRSIGEGGHTPPGFRRVCPRSGRGRPRSGVQRQEQLSSEGDVVRHRGGRDRRRGACSSSRPRRGAPPPGPPPPACRTPPHPRCGSGPPPRAPVPSGRPCPTPSGPANPRQPPDRDHSGLAQQPQAGDFRGSGHDFRRHGRADWHQGSWDEEDR